MLKIARGREGEGGRGREGEGGGGGEGGRKCGLWRYALCILELGRERKS